MVINVTESAHNKNVKEIMFHSVSGDWFTVLFPNDAVKLDELREYYIGRKFDRTKRDYSKCVFVEAYLV